METNNLVTIYNKLKNIRIENINPKFLERWKNLGFEVENKKMEKRKAALI